MAQQDAYTTGVGPYPVAPDTSVDAFLNAHPVYNQDNYWRNLLQQQQRDWIWERDDFNEIHSLYDSWIMQQNNSYNALVKDWETKYNTPLNQSELLEAAGYNRNWLQGATNSTAAAAPPVEGGNTGGYAKPLGLADALINGISSVQSGIMNFLGMSQQLADLRMKDAQIENINANTAYVEAGIPLRGSMEELNRANIPLKGSQKSYYDVRTEKEQVLTPYQMVGPYLQAVKEAANLGLGDNLVLPFFDSSRFPLLDNSILLSGPASDSFFRNMQNLMVANQKLENQGIRLSNEQKAIINKDFLPYQKKCLELQTKLMQGEITLQDYEKSISKANKEIIDATKDSAIKYLNDVNGQAWLNVVDSLGKLFLGVGATIIGARKASAGGAAGGGSHTGLILN